MVHFFCSTPTLRFPNYGQLKSYPGGNTDGAPPSAGTSGSFRRVGGARMPGEPPACRVRGGALGGAAGPTFAQVGSWSRAPFHPSTGFIPSSRVFLPKRRSPSDKSNSGRFSPSRRKFESDPEVTSVTPAGTGKPRARWELRLARAPGSPRGRKCPASPWLQAPTLPAGSSALRSHGDIVSGAGTRTP